MKNTSFGYYQIKFALPYKNDSYELKIGEEYIADIVLLKKNK